MHVYRRARLFFLFLFLFFAHLYFPAELLLDKPWSQVSSLLPAGSCLQFLSRIGFSNPTARRIFIECLLTHALVLSPSQFVHKRKSLRIYTRRMHSGGFELTKLIYTRLEGNLIRHRGDRLRLYPPPAQADRATEVRVRQRRQVVCQGSPFLILQVEPLDQRNRLDYLYVRCSCFD